MARKTMQVAIRVTVEVDLEAWADEYGLAGAELEADPLPHLTGMVEGMLEAQGQRLGTFVVLGVTGDETQPSRRQVSIAPDGLGAMWARMRELHCRAGEPPTGSDPAKGRADLRHMVNDYSAVVGVPSLSVYAALERGRATPLLQQHLAAAAQDGGGQT